MRICSREVVIYLASSFYCFCINSEIGTGNGQGKYCACSMRIKQETRILSHFLQTSNTPPVFSHLLRGGGPLSCSRNGIQWGSPQICSALVLLRAFCPLATYSLSLPEGRQTLKAITVQHSPSLLRARPGWSSVREASGSWCKVRSPNPPGYGLREGLVASILDCSNPQVSQTSLACWVDSSGASPKTMLFSLMPVGPNPQQPSPVSFPEMKETITV